MANDIGQVTNDGVDAAPANPINAMNGRVSATARRKQTKRLRRFDDFNPDLKVPQDAIKARDTWWGIILDVDTTEVIGDKTYYEVELQDGQFVQAYYTDQTVVDEWRDNQKVQVIWNGVDYIIITTPSQKRVSLWWKATDTLLPGTTAKGHILTFNNDTQEYEDLDSEITVSDVEHRNFVLKDEKIQIQLMDVTYETLGSSGLRRKAKSKVRINPGSTGGLVTVYTKGVAAKDKDDADVEVTALLNWASGSKAFEAAKEAFIEYYPDEEKWVIVGGEC